MKRSNSPGGLPRVSQSCFPAIFLFLLLLIAFAACQPPPESPAITDEEIRTLAAGQFDVPADQLEILGRTETTYRWSGRKVISVKLLDRRNDKGFELTIDEGKNAVALADIIQENQNRFTEKYGKIEPGLFDSLSLVAETRTFDIGIWLRADPKVSQEAERLREEADTGRLRALRKQLLDRAQVANRAITSRFVETLSGLNVQPQYVSTTAPLVFLKATPEVIRSLAGREEVNFIYLARVGEDYNNTAIPSVGGSPWPPAGFEGVGVRVAIVEDDGIDFSNPFLAPAFGGRFQVDNTNLGHPTQTAGVVGSRHDVYRGMAPRSTLLSANGGTYAAGDIIAATDWAVTTGDADVLNCSFGYSVGSADHDLIARYFDHIVWHYWRTVTPAAGNSGATLGAPGVAYNVLTVGGIDDADTPWHGDDAIYGNTSWQDPPSAHNDREKPEVCAVATRYLSTEDNTYGQWITAPGGGHFGTSYAAPSVAGEVARLIDRKAYLFTWPEEVKAIVMASAARRVSDATVDTDNPGVDVREGVGTVVVPLAEKVVGMNWHDGDFLTSASFPYNYTFYAEEGDVVRFVIAWDAHTNFAYTSVNLAADLDLWMYDPGNSLIAFSISWDNPYEVVEFTAPSTGTYRARVYDWRFDGSYEWLGLAYSRR